VGSSEPEGAEWRRLLGRGAHAEALHAAEHEGFASVLLSAEPDELYALADAARLAGRSARARQALVALRTRHGERGRTAFLLGRMAAENGDRPDAIRWLEAYVRESPRGALEEAALGRLVELHRESDPARARILAAQYLDRYPSGTYAELARGVSTHR
jgi:hypothetical protein